MLMVGLLSESFFTDVETGRKIGRSLEFGSLEGRRPVGVQVEFRAGCSARSYHLVEVVFRYARD
jgi:hypothetical protein